MKYLNLKNVKIRLYTNKNYKKERL